MAKKVETFFCQLSNSTKIETLFNMLHFEMKTPQLEKNNTAGLGYQNVAKPTELRYNPVFFEYILNI